MKKNRFSLKFIIILLFLILLGNVLMMPIYVSKKSSLLSSKSFFLQKFESKALNLYFGEELRANTRVTYPQNEADIDCFEDGSYVIVWQSYEQDGDSWGIYFKLFDPHGIQKTEEIKANTYTSGDQCSPAVCCFPNGSFVVIWYGNGGIQDNNGVFLKIFNSSGSNQTNDILVNSETNLNQEFPDIHYFSNGSFVVVWESDGQDGNGYGIYTKIFNSTGYNQTNDIQVNSNPMGNQQRAKISCFSNDSFVVVWHNDSTSSDIFGRIFNQDGQALTGDLLINTEIVNNQSRPSVYCISNNTFIVSWQSMGQIESFDIFFKIYNYTAINITDEIRVNDYITSTQFLPDICGYQDGSFVITWYSDGQDGDVDGVFAKFFNSSGCNQTGDLQINVFTTLWQDEPAICCSTGGFIIAWESRSQDGSNDGVYYRIISFSPSLGEITPEILLLMVKPENSYGLLFLGIFSIAIVIIGIVVIWLRKR